ncbi:unnamed protein product, partial [Iphiclides podalirius]
MVQKLVLLFGLFMSATCMVLHQPPLPLYLPLQYQDPTPNYNFAYEVNAAHTGDYKRQQESRRGDAVLGQYSLLQPDGLTRTVEYRADDHSGFNAVVNSEGRSNGPNSQGQDRQSENGNDNERQSNGRLQVEQPWQIPSDQQATPAPLTISHTSLIHHSISNGHNSWI